MNFSSTVALDGDERRSMEYLIFISAAEALTRGLLHAGMDASSPSPDGRICFDAALILISLFSFSELEHERSTRGCSQWRQWWNGCWITGKRLSCVLLCHVGVLTPLTHTLQPDVVIVEATVAVAGEGGEEVWTLSVLAYFRAKHLALVCVWGQRDSSEWTKIDQWSMIDQQQWAYLWTPGGFPQRKPTVAAIQCHEGTVC